jgi:Flp pilus assembly protein TadD
MKQVIVGMLWVLLAGWAAAQQYPPEDFPAQLPTKQQKTTKVPSIDNATDNAFPGGPDTAGESSSKEAKPAGESSSKETKIDLSAPIGDAKAHPNSGVADGVLELRSYNPHKAQKAIEVGDFYFRRDNFRAALNRYQEALQWKPDDAEATFKSAESLEKLGRLQEARARYEAYLKLLPDGPHAKEARKALAKLPAPVPETARHPQPAFAPAAVPPKD